MKTVRIVHEGFPDGLVINEEDFDPQQHAVFGEQLKSLNDMTVKELRAFAGEHGIIIGADATAKEAILGVIQAADFKLNTPDSEEPKA